MAYLYANACLITSVDDLAVDLDASFSSTTSSATSTTTATKWRVDTQFAEISLFHSLNKHKSFLFYAFYVVFANIGPLGGGGASTCSICSTSAY